LHDKPVRDFDYYYDQIVCIGELLSTSIVSTFLTTQGLSNTWVDVRDIIRTDNNFRDARIDWTVTSQKVDQEIRPVLSTGSIVLTQGFIGATDDNESTTLGREGSDYTAAIFANLLDAESLTIWKDVRGVMNADPKQYDKAEWIEVLSYREVIEMAYYGAQVIHPKTIKPLQNKGIPLLVKSFINPEEKGTIIQEKPVTHLPPIIVHKHQQALVELSSRDYSFVGEGLTAELYRIFEIIKFRPNLTQNGAISLLCVVDAHPEKVDQLAHAASRYFDVQVTPDLRLLTIRHYNEDLLNELCANCDVLLRQQTEETIQVLLRER
jgi:aspartate kinase